MDLHIIPECYIDTKLIKALVPPQTRYNHQKGYSTVTKIMQERFKDDFALGIIDRDKKELAYAETFDLIFEIPLRLQLFKKQHHYLIFICPAMEKWLIECADDSQISLIDFNLPHDFENIKNITKTSKSENDDIHSKDLQNLFRELKGSNSKVVIVLKFWIKYLKTSNYQVNIDDLIVKTNQILNNP